MGKDKRGIGTTIVATFGVSGGLLAGLIGGAFQRSAPDWRTAYFIGGGLGVALLVLRIGVVESGMFQAVASTAASSAETSSRCSRRPAACGGTSRSSWSVSRSGTDRHPGHVLRRDRAAHSA